jgi:hypothetical protein
MSEGEIQTKALGRYFYHHSLGPNFQNVAQSVAQIVAQIVAQNAAQNAAQNVVKNDEFCWCNVAKNLNGCEQVISDALKLLMTQFCLFSFLCSLACLINHFHT